MDGHLRVERELRLERSHDANGDLSDQGRQKGRLRRADLQERALAEDEHADEAGKEEVERVELLLKELRNEELGDEEELEAKEAVRDDQRGGEGFLRPRGCGEDVAQSTVTRTDSLFSKEVGNVRRWRAKPLI